MVLQPVEVVLVLVALMPMVPQLTLLHSVASTFSLIPCSQCGISEARQGNNEQFDQNHMVLERSTENQASYSLIIFHAILRVPLLSHRPSCAWLSSFSLAILSALASCHN